MSADDDESGPVRNTFSTCEENSGLDPTDYDFKCVHAFVFS